MLALIMATAVAAPPIEGDVFPLFTTASYGDTVTFAVDWTGKTKPGQRLYLGVWVARDGEAVWLQYRPLEADGRVVSDGVESFLLHPDELAWRPEPPWLPSDVVTGEAFLMLTTQRGKQWTYDYLDRVTFPMAPLVGSRKAAGCE